MDRTAPPPHGAPPPASWLCRRTGGLGSGYWRLWAAMASSNLGDGLARFAFPWLASQLTRDAMAIAGVALATRLPWLLFSLQAGVLGDQLDRRRLMSVANTLRAVVAGGAALLVATDLMTLPVLFLAAFALGMCEVVFDNTSQAILPALVERSRLERANGNIMGAQFVIAELVAQPVAGALIGVALSLPFAIDAGTAAISAALVASIPGRFRTTSAPATARPRMRTQISEGIRWLWQHPLLRTLALALGVMNAVMAGAVATYVLFAQEILRLDGVGFGLLLAGGSLGGLLGSVLAPTITARLGSGRSLLVALAVPIATFTATAITRNAIVVGVAFALFGLVAVMWNVVTVSLRQVLIPDPLLGRVNSVYRFFGWGMMPLGTLLGGGIVRLVESLVSRPAGLRAPFLVAAAVSVVLVAVVAPKLTTAAIDQARRDAPVAS